MMASSSKPSRRSVLVGTVATLLAGCATAPSSPRGPVLPITLVDAFRGRTVGRGVFRVPLAGVERGFGARLVGTVGRGTLTVVEDFFFDDGEIDRLTWRFTRLAPDRWTGQREDTVGEAEVLERGTEVRLSYLADVRSRGRVTRLGFADVIYRRPDGVVVNEAVVTSGGVSVGSVYFEIFRERGTSS